MKRPFTNATMTLALPLLASCGAPAADDRPWIVDRFDDIKVIRYEVPGFENLPLEQKELVYYLSEAAKCGRDILYDQNCPANLPVRRTLEVIYEKCPAATARRPSGKALEKYSKKVCVRQRHPPSLSERQFTPEFTEGHLLDAIETIPEEGKAWVTTFWGRGLPRHFRPGGLSHEAQPARGRRPAAHFVEQLLRRREPGRGRAVLRRDGRCRGGRSRAGLLRPELAAGERPRHGPSPRAHMARRRHVFARDRADRLLAREGRLGGPGSRRRPISKRSSPITEAAI